MPSVVKRGTRPSFCPQEFTVWFDVTSTNIYPKKTNKQTKIEKISFRGRKFLRVFKKKSLGIVLQMPQALEGFQEVRGGGQADHNKAIETVPHLMGSPGSGLVFAMNTVV